MNGAEKDVAVLIVAAVIVLLAPEVFEILEAAGLVAAVAAV